MRRSTVLPRLAGIAAVLFAVLVLLAQNAEQIYFKRALIAEETRGAIEPAVDPNSPTGYAWGQRSQILSLDGSHWVMQTQRMLAEGDLRVRAADYDNHPDGREVHWSASLHWWLGGLAWLWSAFSGCPLGRAVEEVAPFANPLVLLLALLALVPFVWRRFGVLAAGLCALGMVTVTPFSQLFAYADPDHHGLVALCGLLSVLFLVVGGDGWVRNEADRLGQPRDSDGVGPDGPPALATARRWFVASGLAGGAGLWISSATQVPVLIGIGIGVVVAARWCGREASPNAPWRIAPELWRLWGVAGASTSLGFYLLEYFPAHLGMRLEVNHPLYAIAWLGGGDLLFRFSRWSSGGGFVGPGRERFAAVGATVGTLLLPAVILATGDRTFWVSDPAIWALHVDYIGEFRNLFRQLGDVGPLYALLVANPLPLVGVAVAALLWRSELAPPRRTALLLALLPAVVMLALAVQQIRWMGMSCALWLVVVVVLAQRRSPARSDATGVGRELARAGAARAESKRPQQAEALHRTVAPLRWKLATLALAILVVSPQVVQVVHDGRIALAGELTTTPQSLQAIVMRDLAYWLRARVGPADSTVVLSGPSATTALLYHGGFKGVGTLYWENRAGLRTLIETGGATDDTKAWEQILRHGVTYIVVASWDSFVEPSARLAAGLRRGEAGPGYTFLRRLAEGRGYPAWLRPVFYRMPLQNLLQNESVLIYEVVPEQSREEAALRQARFELDRGNREYGEQLLAELANRNPSYLPAWIALAHAQLALNHLEGGQTSLDRISELLPFAETLALDDRLNLAVLIAATGDLRRAGAQIQRCLESADAGLLRKLNPDQLFNFVALADDCGEANTRPEWVRLAVELLPKELRARLEQRRARNER